MKKSFLSIAALLLVFSTSQANDQVYFETKNLKIYSEETNLLIRVNDSLLEESHNFTSDVTYSISPDEKFFIFTQPAYNYFDDIYYLNANNQKLTHLTTITEEFNLYTFVSDFRWSENGKFLSISMQTDTIGASFACIYEISEDNIEKKYCLKDLLENNLPIREVVSNNILIKKIDDNGVVTFSFGENTEDFENPENLGNYSIWEASIDGILIKTDEIKIGADVQPFSDIPTTDPLYPISKSAKDSGWLDGFPDGTLRPDQPITRAEFVKLLLVAFGSMTNDELQMTNETKELFIKKFPDVVLSGWYVPYLHKATNTGIMNGYGDGTLRPDNSVNVSEGLKLALEMAAADSSWQIADGQEGESWEAKYWRTIENNPDFSFLPSNDRFRELTRGEAVQLISVVLE